MKRGVLIPVFVMTLILTAAPALADDHEHDDYGWDRSGWSHGHEDFRHGWDYHGHGYYSDNHHVFYGGQHAYRHCHMVAVETYHGPHLRRVCEY